MNMIDILNSLNKSLLKNEPLTVSDRYYEHKYCVDIQGKCGPVNQRVSFHTNRICLLSLAENHPIIKENKHLVEVQFEIDEQTDRRMNFATGKLKKGGQKLDPDSIICYIKCKDDTLYPVYSCIKGKLIEVNEHLTSNPNLLKDKPVSDGYIALIMPILGLYEDSKKAMITLTEYLSLTD